MGLHPSSPPPLPMILLHVFFRRFEFLKPIECRLAYMLRQLNCCCGWLCRCYGNDVIQLFAAVMQFARRVAIYAILLFVLLTLAVCDTHVAVSGCKGAGVSSLKMR